ncbi:MAG: hypothetical protein SOI26_07955 [Coriobacteriales bacterium]
MSTTTQMNLRIDATLKREGDDALAAAGYTPTQAVRALWGFAAQHRGQPETVREGLSFGKSSDQVGLSHEARAKVSAICRGADIYRSFLSSIGAPERDAEALGTDATPLDELREQELLDRFGDEGLREGGR